MSSPAEAFTPINKVSPYSPWAIRGRVLTKTPIKRTISKRNVEMNCFSIILVDESKAEIRCTFFGKDVARFNSIDVGKVYTLSGGHVMVSDKRFDPTGNDYEIKFNSSSKIELCEAEDPMIPTNVYHFTPIAGIKAGSSVDVIGLVVQTDPKVSVTSKKGTALTKRRIVIADRTHFLIDVNIWNHKADSLKDEQTKIVAIKGGFVSEYQGGLQISVSETSSIEVNPELPEAEDILSWYKSGGYHQEDAISLSSTQFLSDFPSFISSLSLETQQISVIALVSEIMYGRSLVYQACPFQGCNHRKVSNVAGAFRCDNCKREIQDPVWMFSFSFKASDQTESVNVSAFGDDDRTRIIFGGISAGEFAQRTSGFDKTEMNLFLSQFCHKAYKMKLRMRSKETKDGQKRTEVDLVSISLINYAREAKALWEMFGEKMQSEQF